MGRLNGLWAGQGELVSFVYDDGGRLTEQWLPNGVNTRYTYNVDNTLDQVDHRTVGGTLLAQQNYTYDTLGNRETVIDNDPSCSTVTTSTYAYDELNRLTQVLTDEDEGGLITNTQDDYTYDILRNRTSRTIGGTTEVYLYDAANQLTTIRQGTEAGPILSSFQYDLNGNMESKAGTGEVLSMIYNAWDQVTQTQKTWAHTETYGYDDLGRRVRKTVGGAERHYLYDGLDIIAEYGSTWTTTPTARYVHGPGIDTPLIRIGGGLIEYYHQDGLGSVVAVTDQTGEAQGTVRYDAWGNPTLKTGTVPQYGYTGREPDDTGLVYYRARYYDPETGRFTQADPIGLQGGTNLYAYALGNPTNYTDPMGTTPWSVASANANAQNTGYTSQGSGGTGLSGLGYGGQGQGSQQDTQNPVQLAYKEHNSNTNPANVPKHEKGKANKKKSRGGEKADPGRRPNTIKPQNHKGPWPPKDSPKPKTPMPNKGPKIKTPGPIFINPCMFAPGIYYPGVPSPGDQIAKR